MSVIMASLWQVYHGQHGRSVAVGVCGEATGWSVCRMNECCSSPSERKSTVQSPALDRCGFQIRRGKAKANAKDTSTDLFPFTLNM